MISFMERPKVKLGMVSSFLFHPHLLYCNIVTQDWPSVDILLARMLFLEEKQLNGQQPHSLSLPHNPDAPLELNPPLKLWIIFISSTIKLFPFSLLHLQTSWPFPFFSFNCTTSNSPPKTTTYISQSQNSNFRKRSARLTQIQYIQNVLLLILAFFYYTVLDFFVS